MHENLVQINQLLSKDKLEEGIEALAPLTKESHNEEWIMYSSQLAGWIKDKNNGTHPNSELEHRRNAIRLRLINLLNDLAIEKGISLKPATQKYISESPRPRISFRKLIWQTLLSRKWRNIYFWIGITLTATMVFHRLVYQFLPESTFSNILLWGSLVALLFIIAFVKAVYQTYQEMSEYQISTFSHQSSIKGLHPYTSDDWEIFQRLQRDKELSRCIQSIEHSNFQIGVLGGMSGCGKTSFLQAGLKPALEKKGLQIVYIKFSDENPLESVKQALRKHFENQIEKDNQLKDCIQEAVNHSQKKAVLLIFDQFEQFFTNFLSLEKQQPFLTELKESLAFFSSDELKILLSIRSDFLAYIIDFQRALGFSLSADANYFDLKKFTPQQAKEIFGVFAEKEKITFDEKFVMDISQKELANPKDGLISAVDIQVLAMMLDGQREEKYRSFTQEAYEKLGGVEGLLENYLRKHLKTPAPYNQNDAGLKVLMALTDLDNNVRAGQLTQKQIKEKLKGQVTEKLLSEVLDALSSADLRLIRAEIKENGDTKYELAHERMIIPLRKLAGKTLVHLDRLSLMLDRRVNEWLGNERKSRFLLNPQELWRVRKYGKLLSWPPKQAEKEEMVQKSTTKWKRISISLFTPLLIFLLLVIYAQTPLGIYQRILYWDFPQTLVEADDSQKDLIVKNLSITHTEKAIKVARSISNYHQSVSSFISIIDSLNTRVDSSNRTNAFNEDPNLETIIQEVRIRLDSIESFPERIKAYDRMIELALKAEQSALAEEFWGNLKNEIHKADNHLNLTATYGALAVSSSRMGHHEVALAYFDSAENVAQGIEFVPDLNYILTKQMLFYSAAFTDQKEKAIQYLEDIVFIAEGETFDKDANRQSLYEVIDNSVSEISLYKMDIEYVQKWTELIKNITVMGGGIDLSLHQRFYQNMVRTLTEMATQSLDFTFLEEGLKIIPFIKYNSLTGGSFVPFGSYLQILDMASELSKNSEEANYSDQVIQILIERKDSIPLIIVYIEESRKAFKENLTERASKYFDEAIKIYESVEGNKDIPGMVHSQVAKIYSIRANYTKDIKYLNLGEKVVEKVQTSLDKCLCYMFFARELNEINPDLAPNYWEKTKKMFEQYLEEDSYNQSVICSQLVAVATEANQPQYAKAFLKIGENEIQGAGILLRYFWCSHLSESAAQSNYWKLARKYASLNRKEFMASDYANVLRIWKEAKLD